MIRKILLWFQIRALEQSHYWRAETFHLVQDPLTRANMDTMQDQLFNEIIRLKREYRNG